MSGDAEPIGRVLGDAFWLSARRHRAATGPAPSPSGWA
jgi:hypothetical protein